MSYSFLYKLEDFGDPDSQTFKNKNEVIDHLMYLLAQFEPEVLQLREPSGHLTQYNLSGDEI